MKPLIAILLTVASSLAHPVPEPEPEPEPVPANVVAGLFKRAGVTFSSCTVPNTAALTYGGSYFIPLPPNLGFVASMTGHITTWYGQKLRLVLFLITCRLISATSSITLVLRELSFSTVTTGIASSTRISMREGHSLQDLIFGTSNYQSQIKQLYAQGHQLGSCFFPHPSISNQRFLVLRLPYLGPLELSHCIYPIYSSLELDFLLMLPPFVALIGRNQRPNVFIPYRNLD